MCGIVGFVDLQNSLETAERRRTLARMLRRIVHRGPDDEGSLIEADVALGMRRLSIIDLAGGHQPIFNEDKTCAIVFNGEIYNYRELKRELEAKGHRFKTNSDTETIIHLYEEYGADCVKHLRGMFAFAVWNARTRELFLARDRAGEKPLYYALTRTGSLVFGSELKTLLAHPHIERETDIEALDAYLSFGYVPDPLTIFCGIKKVPPAHRLTFKDGALKIERYWDYPFQDEATNKSATELIEELRARLDDAVRSLLIADVPLGAFLSGGIDSSTVVGLMSRYARETNSPPVKTFSIGFREDSFNELSAARMAAEHFRTEHHEFIVTPDICRIVEELVWHFDEPFADSSAIPTYMVSKLARRFVTVALSGDGGDELFAGYTRYAINQNRNQFARLPRAVRRGLMRPLARRLPHSARGRNFLNNIALDQLARYTDYVSIFTDLNKHALYTDDFSAQLRRAASDYSPQADDSPASLRFQTIAANAPTRDETHRLLYLDAQTYLPGDILTKVDRMSMAVSLETRAPLLDYKLMEFVARIPSRLKLREGETKHILKRAVADLVPPPIIARVKQGFGVPMVEWINSELREMIRDTITSARARSRGIVNQKYVDVLLDEHERKRRDHSMQIWTLFMLELWQRRYVDGDDLDSAVADESENVKSLTNVETKSRVVGDEKLAPPAIAGGH
jgi:asparagine synthase (glutamine-hydrolysing)